VLLDDGRVVSNFIVQALNGEVLTLYGDGSQIRSFFFVDDLIAGMIRLMDDAHTGETIVLAKAGRPWARLMPLEPPPAHRRPVEISWPLAASRSPARAPLSRGIGGLGP